jgi:hypothetical protein
MQSPAMAAAPAASGRGCRLEAFPSPGDHAEALSLPQLVDIDPQPQKRAAPLPIRLFAPRVEWSRLSFSHYLPRILVFARSDKTGMTRIPFWLTLQRRNNGAAGVGMARSSLER